VGSREDYINCAEAWRHGTVLVPKEGTLEQQGFLNVRLVDLKPPTDMKNNWILGGLPVTQLQIPIADADHTSLELE
jgi:hypothetical protein